jgi:glutathione S-transferase
MTLKLYFHPLSSFCQKVLIALYENDTPFEPHIVDLGDPASNAAFKAIWPIGKFPVLRDDARDRTVPESTVIIEYLASRFPSRTPLLPSEPETLREVRLRDRFFDLYLNVPMQKIVTDRLRPKGKNDSQGVEDARALLQTALRLTDEHMAGRTWAAGDTFTMADCAAAPPLFYANLVMPFGETHKHAAAYFARLMDRPSFARAVKEAQPYLKMFPQ